MTYFPILGSNESEDIELGRFVDPQAGISNKIRYGGERHVLLFGANGSGKGTRILLPNLLDMRGARSLVVVDPKGELAAVSAPFRRQVSRVVILNPFGVMLDRQGFQDMRSVGFNPLAFLDPCARDFNVNASLLAEAMISIDSKEPHWDESARALLASLMMYTVLEARKCGRVPTMARVRYLLCLASSAPDKFNSEGIGIPQLARDMMRSNIDGLRNKASQFTEWSREIQSVASTAKRQTECFDDPEISDDLGSLTAGGFDFRDLKREPTTVYLVIPPDKMERHGKWLRLVLTAALQATMRPRESGEPRVLFMLDEFAALGHMRIIENVWSVVRGYGIQMMPVFQDLNQLKSLYHERWETFIANAGAIASFAPNDLTTATWLSNRMGDTTRTLRTASTSLSKSGGSTWGNSEGVNASPHGGGSSSGNSSGGSDGWSKSSNNNTSPVKVPLMSPQDLMGLDPGYMLLFMAGLQYPVPIYAPAYYEIEQRRNRARVNPYYQPVPRLLTWSQTPATDWSVFGDMKFHEPFARNG